MAVTVNTINDNVLIVADRHQDVISPKHYSRFTQYLVWPLVYLLSSLFLKIKIKGQENLNNIKSPFIVISNHVSFYDSFLFRLFINKKYLPLRFMAVKRFNWKSLNILAKLRIIDFIYSFFGVFIIVHGRGVSENLKMAREIILSGENVVIYPEGGIAVNAGVGEFKKGAVILARETGAAVLPISFKRREGKMRTVFEINIGELTSINPVNADLANTKQLETIVRTLYNS